MVIFSYLINPSLFFSVTNMRSNGRIIQLRVGGVQILMTDHPTVKTVISRKLNMLRRHLLIG